MNEMGKQTHLIYKKENKKKYNFATKKFIG